MTDPIASQSLYCSIFLIIAFIPAIFCHVLWLKSRVSHSFRQPIDGGKTFRGQRIFGENKMLRGLIVLPIASGLSFYVIGACRASLPAFIVRGIWWTENNIQLAAQGAVAGLALMLAELPNSFLKRQLKIAPGRAPLSGTLKVVCFVFDRLDSIVGALCILSLLAPLTYQVWLWTIIFGVFVHSFFSVVLYLLKIKDRPL